MLTLLIVTPWACAWVSALDSQLAKAGSSAASRVELGDGPSPVSEMDSGLPVCSARVTASWNDQPAAVRPGVGLYCEALVYCQKCDSSVAFAANWAAVSWVVPLVDQLVVSSG